MNKKREDISHFQASKEESIKLASAQRDAVLIVTTMAGFKFNSTTSDATIENEIIKWRNWFLSDDFQAPPF